MTSTDILLMKGTFDKAEDFYAKGDYATANHYYEKCCDWFSHNGSGIGDTEIDGVSIVKSILNQISIRRNSIPASEKQAYNYILTKSKYIKGLQCQKALWLDTFARKAGVITPEQQVKFEAGRTFEAKFKSTFSEGIDLKAKLKSKIKDYAPDTLRLLEKENVIIFEAGFIFENTLVLTDVLQKQGDMVDIYEVKHGTKLTNVILQDLSIQYYVVKSVLGDNLQSFNLVLNDGSDGFKIIDVTDVLKFNRKMVEDNIEKFRKIALDSTHCPQIEIGEHCNYPYKCEFKLVCENKLFSVSTI